MSPVQIFCTTEFCQHNEQKRCNAGTIHLEGFTPDADNVFACSEFSEKGTTVGSLLESLKNNRKDSPTSKPDIECKNCGWQGFTENDTPEGGLLKIHRGDEGWAAYGPIDDPDDEGVWVCPKCFLPEDGGIMSI